MRVAAVLCVMAICLGVVYEDDMKIGWDPVTLDVNGNPEAVASAEVGIFLTGSDTPVRTEKGIDPAGSGWNFNSLMVDLPDGVYQLKVRVYDVASNVSVWSDPEEVTYDKTPPAKPGGCRIFK